MNAARRRDVTWLALAGAAILGVSPMSPGQRVPVPVPFFQPGPTAFEPEIGIVQTGVLNDVQATVSADRKYVTLNMRVADSRLLALRDYTFQTNPNNPNARNAQNNQPLGFVGMGRP